MKKREYKKLVNDIYSLMKAEETKARLGIKAVIRLKIVNDLKTIGFDIDLERYPKPEQYPHYIELAKNFSYLLADITWQDIKAMEEHIKNIQFHAEMIGIGHENFNIYPVYIEMKLNTEFDDTLPGETLYEKCSNQYLASL